MILRRFAPCLSLFLLLLVLIPSESSARVPGNVRLILYESGTGTENGGVEEIYASVGDIISIDVFVRNDRQNPISIMQAYFTVNSEYFDIVPQGINREKNEYEGTPKPFIKGNYLGGSIQTKGNNTWGDSLSAGDNGYPGWQMNYQEITPPDVGFGRPSSNRRYGVLCTFQLLVKKPCVGVEISLDDDHNNLRESTYGSPSGNESFTYKSFTSCKITAEGVELNPPLNDLLMRPASADSSLDLDEHVGVATVPDSLLTWSVKGNNQIDVTIDPKSHVVIFVAPEGFRGYENIIFSVVGGTSISASDTMRVTVDMPPQFIPSAIPDTLYVNEDMREIALLLRDVVIDTDDSFEELTFTFSSTGNIVTTTNEDTLFVQGKQDFFGLESLTATVMDQFDLTDTVTLPVKVLPVNDAPVIQGLPDIQFERNKSYQFEFSEYVTDVDGDSTVLSWNTTDDINVELIGSFVKLSNRQNFLGTEYIVFTVTDPFGLADSDTLLATVTQATNPPIWLKLPKVGFAQGGADSSVVLWDYIYDSDDDDMAISFEFSNYNYVDIIHVNPNNGRMTMYDVNNTVGWDLITIKATDRDGNSASTTMKVFIGNADGSPIVSDIPDTTIVAGSTLQWIDLDDYYYDIDNVDNQMIWTWTRQAPADSSITIFIDPITHRVRLGSVSNDSEGFDRIIFTVTDPIGRFASDASFLRVLGKGFNPMLNLPVKFGLVSGVKDTLDFDNYVQDPNFNKTELTWLPPVGNVQTKIVFEEPNIYMTRPVSFESPPSWKGVNPVIFGVNNPLGGAAQDTLLVFTVGTDGAPVAGGLSNLVIKAGGCVSIDLDNYYYDADSYDGSMVWTVSGNVKISVVIDPITHVATICSPDKSWGGQETLTLTVTDPDGNTGSMSVMITITDVILRDILSLMIFRNPMQEDYMDLFVRSTVSLNDIPTMKVFLDSDSTMVSLGQVVADFYYGRYLLPLDISLGERGVSIVELAGKTPEGHAVQDSSFFAYGRLGDGGGKIVMNSLSLSVPANALEKQSLITVIPGTHSAEEAKKSIPLEVTLSPETYRISALPLHDNASAEISFDMISDGEGSGIYRSVGETWVYVGGSRNHSDSGIMCAELFQGGEYAIGYDITPPQAVMDDKGDGLILISVNDLGSGVAMESIALFQNGSAVPWTFDPKKSEISASILSDGDEGSVTLEFSVSDRSGNMTNKTFSMTGGIIPGQISVGQNTPNPFNPSTVIHFELSDRQNVTIEIYDMLGRKVLTLANEMFSAGQHSIVWNARDSGGRIVSTGTYFCRLSNEKKTVTRKMMFLR